MTGVPTGWRNVLPHLDYDLPDDLPPQSSLSGGVKVNLPLELLRQSRSRAGTVEIPGEVLDQYRRYRPTSLWHARDFGEAVGARVPIYVKYEGANISGSHKLNTALAQAYYYRRAGVQEVVTGTGAGQWGTAIAAACAVFGLRCTVFMVGDSLRRKPYRGTIMRLLGATVHSSPSGLTEVAAGAREGASGNSLALAIGEAVEYAATRDRTAFVIGSGETYSILHQTVIGTEAIEQLAARHAEVDAVIGCVGAGSNFGGIAMPFFADAAEGAGPAPLLLAAESSTTPKLTRGVYAYDRTDATGFGPREAMYTVGSEFAIPPAHAAGLRFHGTAKLLSAMRHRDQIAATAVGQVEAMDAARLFAVHENVVPAPESGHALAAAARVATSGVSDREAHHVARRGILVCLSGHGYLDLAAYEEHLTERLRDESPDDDLIKLATTALSAVPIEGGHLRVP
ncbi:TrpB-like pyridoxal phosphate-dependent enzyme [Amycolatopsis mediterranei]|uniref:TrpB-like pyridoxal phosphate-dependent enzyme n=1 Tax=Amycolatopsis mediterranei TaxID=33910 RepID=UPI00343D8432